MKTLTLGLIYLPLALIFAGCGEDEIGSAVAPLGLASSGSNQTGLQYFRGLPYVLAHQAAHPDQTVSPSGLGTLTLVSGKFGGFEAGQASVQVVSNDASDGCIFSTVELGAGSADRCVVQRCAGEPAAQQPVAIGDVTFGSWKPIANEFLSIKISPDASGVYPTVERETTLWEPGHYDYAYVSARSDLFSIYLHPPMFSARIVDPPIGPGSNVAISRAKDLTVSWDLGGPASDTGYEDELAISLFASTSPPQFVTCRFSAERGSATIPAAALAQLPASSNGLAVVQLENTHLRQWLPTELRTTMRAISLMEDSYGAITLANDAPAPPPVPPASDPGAPTADSGAPDAGMPTEDSGAADTSLPADAPSNDTSAPKKRRKKRRRSR